MQSYLALLYLTTLGFNLTCVLFVGATKLRDNNKQYKVVMVCCALTALLQFSAWQYHISESLDHSLVWLRFQTAILLISIPPYLLLYDLWANKRGIAKHISVISSFAFLLFVINLVSDNTMRFSSESITSLQAFELPWGEIAYKIIGQTSHWMTLFVVLSLSALGIIMCWVWASRKSLCKTHFRVITISLLFQTGVIFTSALSSQGYVDAVLLAGFPFTLFNLLCCLQYSMLTERRGEQLDELKYKTDALENILVTLSKGIEKGNTTEFFASVIKKMQLVSGASTGIILRYDGPAKYNKLKTAIAVHKQKMIENFSFSIDQIPNDFRDPSEFHIVTQGLAEKYPNTEFYKNIKAQAMISVPMLDQFSNPIGVLSLYFRRPSIPDKSFINVVKVCAARLAAEYSRDKAFEQLKASALCDYLTKLPNLMGLNNQLALNLEHNPNSTYILIKLDIDGFAEVNRKFGFDNAELVLQILGERFNNYVQKDLFIARTGGDEFTFLQSNVSDNKLAMLKIHWEALSAIVREKIIIDDNEISLTCSGGAVIAPEQIPKNTDALRCAEYALRNAKRSGKEQMLLFDTKMANSIDRLHLIQRELKAALTSKHNTDMFVVFQPKVNNHYEIVGAESLSRWIHPELGFISPVEFIEVAESFNLIKKLGFWCIESVCKSINNWRENGFVLNGRVGINVSAQQLDDPEFIIKLREILTTYNVEAQQIDLELTESSLMNNFSHSRNVLNELRKEGFSISLDDFGTGYSSLSYLKDLPLDYLKIDRSFVSDIKQENSAFLLKTIIDIANNMHLQTIAEGVEQWIEVKLLQDLGCDLYQGYYFSEPLTARKFFSFAESYSALEYDPTLVSVSN